jgi:hypothetical protein
MFTACPSKRGNRYEGEALQGANIGVRRPPGKVEFESIRMVHRDAEALLWSYLLRLLHAILRNI